MGFGNATHRASHLNKQEKPELLDCARLAINGSQHLYESVIRRAVKAGGLWTRYCPHQLALRCSGPAGGIPTIDQELSYTPQQVTRNRKPLEQRGPYGATWELRFGPKNRFRVFYEVDAGKQTVEILAIGVKDRSRLEIGGEEYRG